MRTTKHPSTCPCLDVPFAIPPAPPKETLAAFGGTVDIAAYRSGFVTVKSLCLLFEEALPSAERNVMSSRERRAYVYEYKSMDNGRQVMEIRLEEPVVTKSLIQRLKTTALF